MPSMDALEGLKVLVVEDEGPVAMLIEDMLDDLGCVLAGSVASIREALDCVEQGGFAFALLDVNLAGQKVDPVADELLRRGVPFAFASGYGVSGLREDLRRAPVLQKPFQSHDLAAVIRRAIA